MARVARRGRARRGCWPAVLALATLAVASCSEPWQTATLVAGGATVAGAYSPNNEIQQIYYLGVFDPQEQLPPTVYRIRVHGQASFISRTRFASGWVPAEIIDSLGTTVRFDKQSGDVEIGNRKGETARLSTGRRLMLFGPEGFREAPADHRLVVVMGASPDAFFQAVDSALGTIAQATQQQQRGDPELERQLFQTLVQIRAERERIDDLLRESERTLLAGS